MEIIKQGNLTLLKAKEGYKLREIKDNYIPKSIDEEENVIEEYIPYYFDKAYVPNNMTLEKLEEMYEEVEAEKDGK